MTNFFVLDEELKQSPNTSDKILFRNSSEFSMYITNLANQTGTSLTYSILQYCEERDLDPEDIAKFVSKPLKELLAIEMQESGLMNKESSAEFE